MRLPKPPFRSIVMVGAAASAPAATARAANTTRTKPKGLDMSLLSRARWIRRSRGLECVVEDVARALGPVKRYGYSLGCLTLQGPHERSAEELGARLDDDLRRAPFLQSFGAQNLVATRALPGHQDRGALEGEYVADGVVAGHCDDAVGDCEMGAQFGDDAAQLDVVP